MHTKSARIARQAQSPHLYFVVTNLQKLTNKKMLEKMNFTYLTKLQPYQRQSDVTACRQRAPASGLMVEWS